jgi:hypothetical protein
MHSLTPVHKQTDTFTMNDCEKRDLSLEQKSDKMADSCPHRL